MTSPAVVITNPSPAYSASLAFRAVELERLQRRNLSRALLVSIAIHALALGIYFLFPSLQPPIDTGNFDWRKPHSPSDRDRIDLEDYTFPSPGGGGVPKSTDFAGKIVAVPDVEADLTKSFSTQDQLKRGEGLTGTEEMGEGPGISTGNGTETWVPIEEPEPPPFLAVEREPMPVKRVAPRYPDLARRAGIEGKVVVRIWVTKEGKVREVRLFASDHELFNEAALEAARQFLFTPAYMNSGPVAVWVSVPFSFKLKN